MENDLRHRSLSDAEHTADLKLGVLARSVKTADVLRQRHGDLGVRATTDVFCMRHGLQVVRVYAARVPAQVIKVKALGDRTLVDLVHHTMSGLAAGLVLPSTVPSGIRHPLPLPTSGVGIDDVTILGRSVLVSLNEPNRMPHDPASMTEGVGRDLRGLTATALTQTGRIRRGQQGSFLGGIFSAGARMTARSNRDELATRRTGFILWTRHSLTSYIGRGIRRSPDGYRRAGVFACQF